MRLSLTTPRRFIPTHRYTAHTHPAHPAVPPIRHDKRNRTKPDWRVRPTVSPQRLHGLFRCRDVRRVAILRGGGDETRERVARFVHVAGTGFDEA